ncbi:MAG: hypothetical protein EA426_17850 [Spirochaetaceae bacterium]|nr:MAG: hypothetical protein EA426_17850 [Spirochaetaceae bacterium]
MTMNTRKLMKFTIGVVLAAIVLAGCDLLTQTEPEIVKINDLTIENVTLSPEFDWSELEYTATVPAETETVTVSVERDQDEDTVRINSVEVIPGSGSKEVDLDPGESTISIRVSRGAQNTAYTVAVTRGD